MYAFNLRVEKVQSSMFFVCSLPVLEVFVHVHVHTVAKFKYLYFCLLVKLRMWHNMAQWTSFTCTSEIRMHSLLFYLFGYFNVDFSVQCFQLLSTWNMLFSVPGEKGSQLAYCL